MNDSDKHMPNVPSRDKVAALCILGGLAGAFVGFVFGAIFAEVVNMPNVEGSSGYFALAIGMGGSGLGFMAGIGCPLYWYHKRKKQAYWAKHDRHPGI